MAFLDYSGLSHFLDKLKTLFVPLSQKGAANGIAELDSNKKVPTSQLPSFLSLGETSSTAYRGDRGKTAYDHASDSSRATSAVNSGLYKVSVTSQGHIGTATTVQKSDITALGIPAQDTTYQSKAAASGGTDVSLVTTGEKAVWNAKTSNTGTVTKVSTGAGLTGGDITTSGTISINGMNTSSGATTKCLSQKGTWENFSNNAGTVTSVKINGAAKNPSSGVVDLGSGYLTSHQTIKQDGITGAEINRYGVCSTAAGTAAKTVSITSGSFSRTSGSMIAVKFNNKNTANSPTLNVDGTGAANIFVNGEQITTAGNKSLLAGAVVFLFDGTQYHLIGNYYDTNSTNFVPTTRKINNKELSSDITLSASDVGAAPSSTISCTETNVKTALSVGTGETKYFREDGTWDVPPGAKPYVVELGSITNTSGSYTHTFTVSNIRDDMKAIQFECSNPEIFQDAVTISTGDNSITVTCSSVSGTSTSNKVTVMETASAEQGIPGSVTSNEFNTLASRIGTLSNLTTTEKSNLVGAINEVKAKFKLFTGKYTFDSNYQCSILDGFFTTSTFAFVFARYGASQSGLIFSCEASNGKLLITAFNTVNNTGYTGDYKIQVLAVK